MLYPIELRAQSTAHALLLSTRMPRLLSILIRLAWLRDNAAHSSSWYDRHAIKQIFNSANQIGKNSREANHFAGYQIPATGQGRAVPIFPMPKSKRGLHSAVGGPGLFQTLAESTIIGLAEGFLAYHMEAVFVTHGMCWYCNGSPVLDFLRLFLWRW